MKRAARTLWFGVVIVLGLLGVAGRACEAAEPAKEPPIMKERSGTITLVDVLNGTMTIASVAPGSNETTQRMFLVNKDTVIVKGGVPLQLSDLQASNEHVTIQYASEERQALARSITFEPPSGLKRISGKVETVDLIKGQLVVRPAGILSSSQRMAFSINESSLLSQGRQRTYLANVKTGDDVTVQYTVDDDQHIARFIEVLSQSTGQFGEPRGPSSQPQRQAPKIPGYSPSQQ